MKAAHELEPGDLLMGKFRVEKRLGAGAMGVVYAAQHVELGHRVAIKVLRARAAQGDLKVRFLREARASVSLKSEHVARVFDVGTTDDGAPYMVMEHLDGRDLADELKARGPLPVEEAVEYLLQVCEAVAEAHAAGIVHRDIKPANLFLTTGTGGLPRVKVLDFGISKVSDDVALTGDMALGSPLYMAPEHMRASAQVDARADIWALGVTLYELIAGKPPFHGDNLQTVCALVFNDPPTPLANYRTDAPQGLEVVLGHCLEKDRTRRFPSVAALAAALVPYAPQRARVYAERAALALGEQASIARPTDVLPPAPSGTHAGVVTGAGRASGSVPAFTQTPPSGSPATTGAPTVSAARAEAPPPKSKAWIAAVAALVVGGGAAAVVFGMMARGGGVPVAAGPPSAMVSAPAAPRAAEPVLDAGPAPVVEPSATASAPLPAVSSSPPRTNPPARRQSAPPAAPPPKPRRNIYDQ